jgi:uncharacterized protein (TIGR02996 family)
MPMDDSLLAAVLAEPDQNEPRHAYADSLQSGWDKDRAEFIRLQITISALMRETEDWPELARRERQLLELHADAWEKPLRSALRSRTQSTGEWIRKLIFGTGGTWGFRRGFVEQVINSATDFLHEDVHLFEFAPVRQILLTNSSRYIPELVKIPKLDTLRSLYLVADVEFDDEMNYIVETARELGLTTLAFSYPHLDADQVELISNIREISEDQLEGHPRLVDNRIWQACPMEVRSRLRQMAITPRYLQLLSEPRPAFEIDLLMKSDWVFFGNTLKEAGCWAMAKTFHDLDGPTGYCQRIGLFKPDRIKPEMIEKLKASPWCVPTPD